MVKKQTSLPSGPHFYAITGFSSSRILGVEQVQMNNLQLTFTSRIYADQKHVLGPFTPNFHLRLEGTNKIRSSS